jgi:hypothetical protein
MSAVKRSARSTAELIAKRGFKSGVRSVFDLSGRGRPAPPLAHRSTGSLRDDARQLSRDADRLFSGTAA